MKPRIFYLLIVFPFSIGYSNTIKSVSGNINFDPNNDGVADIVVQSEFVGFGTTSPIAALDVSGNTYVSDSVGISVTTPVSNLEIGGTFGFSSQSISSNVELSGNSYVFVDAAASGANLDITLPSTSNISGRMYTIKKSSAGNTVKISGGSTIDGLPSITLLETSDGEMLPYVQLINDGSVWHVLSGKNIEFGDGGLMAWYTFDETSGNTIYDRTPGTQTNGTLTGGFSFSSNTVSGQFGNALVFDGTDDHIDLGDADELFFSTQVTIAAWVKVFTHDRAVWEKSNNFAYGHITLEFDGFGGNPEPNFRVMGSDFTLRSATANSNASTTEWVHVVGRYRTSDSEVSIFINGVKQTDTETMTASTAGVASTYRNTYIGAMSNAGNPNRFMSGQIDDLRFYYGALSDVKILALYNEKP